MPFYSKLIYKVAKNEKEDRVRAITNFDKQGGVIPKGVLSGLLSSPVDRICVRLGISRATVEEATKKLHNRLERRLFPTGEALRPGLQTDGGGGLRFDVDLRVSFNNDPQEVAKAHWHPELTPEEYFFSAFAEMVELRLERSVGEFDGTIDQRIAKYHVQWREEIARALSDKFKIDVELRFSINVAPPKVSIIEVGRGRDASFRVAFKDRIDKEFPLAATMSLDPVGSGDASFPFAEDEQRTIMRNLISAICQEDVFLYDYWFDAETLTQSLMRLLNVKLAEYGRKISTLAITPPTDAPLRMEREESTCSWKDSLGLSIDFHATGHISVARDGAGIYDRENQPDKKKWFNSAIEHELKERLAGCTVLSIDKPRVVTLEEEVKQGIAKRAKAIGLTVEPFVGDPELRYQDLMKTTYVPVVNRDYPTAHPKIPAEFSMELSVRFTALKGLLPFIREAGGAVSNDEITNVVKEGLAKLAEKTAAYVMQDVDATDYFAAFEEWSTSVSGLGEPAYDEEAGESLIKAQISRVFHERHPDLELIDIKFHRIDQRLENLRAMIGQVRKITCTTTIPDLVHYSKALDRKIRVTAYVEGGNAKRVVKMLEDKLTETGSDIAESAHIFRMDVEAGLEEQISIALRKADQSQLEGLVDSLIADGVGGATYDDLRMKLIERLRNFLADIYGIISNKIDLFAKETDYEDTVRDARGTEQLVPIQVHAKRIESKKLELEKLEQELGQIRGNSIEQRDDRERIRDRIQTSMTELAQITRESQGDDVQSIGARASLNAERFLPASQKPSNATTITKSESGADGVDSGESDQDYDANEDGL